MSGIDASAATDGWPDDQATTRTLGDSGIVLGQTDAYGVRWLDTSSDMIPKASLREATGPNEVEDGDWDATRFRSSLAFDVSLRADAPSHAALHAAKRRLWAILGPKSFLMTMTEPGFTGIASVRQQGQPTWAEASNGRTGLSSGRSSFTLYSRRSFVESAALRTFTLNFAVDTGGLDFTDPGADWSDPGADYSSSGGVGNTITVTNPGPFAVAPRLHLTAPTTWASLVVQQGPTTQVLNLANPFGVLLDTSQYLDIDCRTGAVTLNGPNGSGRGSWATGVFPRIPPGNSTLTLLGPAVGGQMTGEFRAVHP